MATTPFMQGPESAPLPPDFMAQWAVWYPHAPPVGFLLRETRPDTWLRIHSLPASKRYPESAPEQAELARRHNRVATEVLGAGATCAVVVFAPCRGPRVGDLGSAAGLATGPLPRIAQLSPELWDERDGIFEEPMCVFGFATRWSPGAFDAFITATADDRVRGLLVELGRGQVYAPYDGGADLFFATSGERDAARERYSPWLSSDASGL